MGTYESYQNEISELQDLLYEIIMKQLDDAISEEASVYQDINDYFDSNFEGWYTKDYIQFIEYLKKLIGVGK